MKKLRSGVGVFLSGGVSILLLLALLVVFGVLPVKTDHTTVVEPAAATTTTALTTSGSLTPSQIYQKYSAGVVEVLATYRTAASQSFFGQIPSSTSQSLGSGFVVSNDGYILTNAHVVTDNGQAADSVSVVFKGSGSQTTTVPAKVVGVDQTSDVAVLKIDPARSASSTPSSWATPARCRSARPSWPSATRSASTSRSRRASSRRPTATCSHPMVRRSPTASRPTRPSTRATPAAPSSTRPAT